jgi:hypothetical protein
MRSWAAPLRHEDTGENASRITDAFQFTAKPRNLRFVLDPLMGAILRFEVRKRLRALKRHSTHPVCPK